MKTIHLISPRGFCAGVVRAIDIVERALDKFGAPVYVRHEIVHNAHVVNDLRDKGAVFVKELDEIPDGCENPVIFSAHGVPKSVPENARFKNLFYVDATCPLVSKVHNEAIRAHDKSEHVILIGHQGHPEVIGTMGQLPQGCVTLVETVDDVDRLDFTDEPLTVVTQTTLSVDDTADILYALKEKYPHIRTQKSSDICYATTNRQQAVKAIAPKCDLFLVVGSPNSSNSNRLVEVAKQSGCPESVLIGDASHINWQMIDNAQAIGLSAGASAPDHLVQDVITQIDNRYETTVDDYEHKRERVAFKLPDIVA